jgi:DNA-binding transcriptional ArsR family regulator
MDAGVSSGPEIATTAALVADATRASMLSALMGGKALAAGELARVAGVTPQTCSGHLSKLTAAGFIRAAQQGRHRYYLLASPDIARLLEALQVAHAGSDASIATGPRDRELAYARVCYDHLAGQLGVALLARFHAIEWIVSTEAGIALTPLGRDRLTALGVQVQDPGRRVECRECMDWSERRMHLAGHVGAQLLTTMLARGWLRRRKDSRALLVSEEGRRGLGAVFDVLRCGV